MNNSLQPVNSGNSVVSEESSTEYDSPGLGNNEETREGKDIVRVFVRIKPIISNLESSIQIESSKQLSLYDPNQETIKKFDFEKIFTDSSTSEEIFCETTMPLLRHALLGENSVIFVYGPTGTGKTHTMGILSEMTSESIGIIPSTLRYLFNYFSQVDAQYKEKYNWQLNIGLFQIYLEEAYDLLNPGGPALALREDPENKEVYLQNLTSVSVESFEQAVKLLNVGIVNRVTAAQSINEYSSRSHMILSFQIMQSFTGINGRNETIVSKVNLIDLAGSERVQKSTSKHLRLEEAKSINSSLSALGMVISALRSPDFRRFVPYRSSKLTRVIQSSLNRHSKISLIATITPESANFYETMSTLIFAQNCKEVVLKPSLNTPAAAESITTESVSPDQYLKKMQKNVAQLAEELLYKEQEYRDEIKQRENEIEELRKATKNAEIIRSSLQNWSQYPNDSNSNREKSEYLFKLLRSLRDFVFEKSDEVAALGDTQIESVKNQKETDFHGIVSEIQKLNEIFAWSTNGLDPENISEKDEVLIAQIGLEEAINLIQKVIDHNSIRQEVGKSIVDSIKNLAANAENAEKLKVLLATERYNSSKLRSETTEKQERVEIALAYMVKYNLDLEVQNINLQYPFVNPQARNTLLKLKEKEIENILRPLLAKKQKEEIMLTSERTVQASKFTQEIERLIGVSSSNTTLQGQKKYHFSVEDNKILPKEGSSAKIENQPNFKAENEARINSATKITNAMDKTALLTQRSQRTDDEFYRIKANRSMPVPTKETATPFEGERLETHSSNFVISPLCSSTRIIETQWPQKTIGTELFRKTNNDSFSFNSEVKTTEKMKAVEKEAEHNNTNPEQNASTNTFFVHAGSLQELDDKKESDTNQTLLKRIESLNDNELEMVGSNNNIEQISLFNRGTSLNNTSIELQTEQNPQIRIQKISQSLSSLNTIPCYVESSPSNQLYEPSYPRQAVKDHKRVDSKQSLLTRMDSKQNLSTRVGTKLSIKDSSRPTSNVLDEKESEFASFQNSIVLEEDPKILAEYTIDQNMSITEELGSIIWNQQSESSRKRSDALPLSANQKTISLQVQQPGPEPTILRNIGQEQHLNQKNEESKLNLDITQQSNLQAGRGDVPETPLDVSPTETRTYLDTSRSRRFSTLDYSPGSQELSHGKRRRRRTQKRFLTDYSKFSAEQLDMINALENFDLGRYESEEAAKQGNNGRLNSKPLEEIFSDPFKPLNSESSCLEQDKFDSMHQRFKQREKSPSLTRQIGVKTHILKDRPDVPAITTVSGLENQTNRHNSLARQRTRGLSMPPRPNLSIISNVLKFKLALEKAIHKAE